MAGVPVLASCSDTIKLWELPNTTPIKSFNPHSKSVTSLSWSANNQVLISGSSDGSISVSLRGAQVLSLEGHGMGPINSVSCSSSSRLLAAGDETGYVHVWELKNRDILKSFKVSQLSQDTSTTCVQFNASDSHIAAGSNSGDIVLYSMTTNQTVANFQVPDGKESGVRDLKYSPFNRNILAACSDDGGIYMWDTHTRKLNTTFPHQHTAPTSALVFSPANRLLLSSCGLDKKILFYDTQDKKVVKIINADSPLNCMSFMEDGITLAAGSTQGKIFVYDLRKGSTPTHVLKAHEPFPVNAIHYQHPRSLSVPTSSTASSASNTSTAPTSVHAPANSLPTTSSSAVLSSVSNMPTSLSKHDNLTIDPSITSLTNGTTKVPNTFHSSSDVAAFSPIKGTKGSSAPPATPAAVPPPTSTQTRDRERDRERDRDRDRERDRERTERERDRDTQHREIMLKAQRVLQQPVPNLPSGLSTKSLKALQQGDDPSSVSKPNGLRSSSDINVSQKPSTTSIQLSPSSSPVISPTSSSTTNKFPTDTLNSPETTSAYAFPGPRAASTPNIHSFPASTPATLPRQPSPPFNLPTSPIIANTPASISLVSPIFPPTPSASNFPQTSPVSYTLPQPPYTQLTDTTIQHASSAPQMEPDSGRLRPTSPQQTHKSYQPMPMEVDPSPAANHDKHLNSFNPSKPTPDVDTHMAMAGSPTTKHARTKAASPPRRDHADPPPSFVAPVSALTTSPVRTSSSSHQPTSTISPPSPTPPSYTSPPPPPSSHTHHTHHTPPLMPIHDVQRALIASVLDESLAEFKASIRQDVQNLHLELIRQFQLQQLEMRDMLEQYVQNSQRELIEEIKALRQENTILRQRVFY